MRSVLRPSQESQPVACTQWYNSVLPHGKAFCGCSAPVAPPLRTAVRQCTGRRTQAAGQAAICVRVLSPAHWSLSVPLSGQTGGVWLPRRASGISADCLLSQAAVTARWPMDATGRACRWLLWTRSAARCFVLLTGVGPSHALVGPVPLWCGGLHAAAVRHASRRMGAPPPYGSVAARGGADPAVFRPTQGRGRGRSHQARAWGYSPQSSWPAPCPGTCLYSAYGVIMKRYAQK